MVKEVTTLEKSNICIEIIDFAETGLFQCRF